MRFFDARGGMRFASHSENVLWLFPAEPLAVQAVAASILLVSTDSEVIAAVQRAIATMGHSLRVASSLEEAGRAQQEKAFGALLLQTDAPNGHEASRMG